LQKGKEVMMNRIALFCVVFFLILLTTGLAQNYGKKEILIDGGKKGNILFPHQAHQSRIKDCKVCHASFPQKQGALKESMGTGVLKKKQVMNTICLKCHREDKNAGKTHGPVKCSGCHAN
jgi:DNA-directed RNA polymerase subunit M/transcription elongation factor TFIIS